MGYNGTLTTDFGDNGFDWRNASLQNGDHQDNNYSEWIPEFSRIVDTVCYSLVFCLSSVGNGFILWALLRHEDLKRTSNLLLLHLSVSGLIFAVPLPVWAAYENDSWVMGEAVCKLLQGLWCLSLHSYMTFLMAMTVHRYKAVVHALHASSFTPHVHTVCGAIWLFCLVFSVPMMVFSQTLHDGEHGYCFTNFDSEIISDLIDYLWIIFFFLLPFAVITFCYMRMWFRVRRCRMAAKRRAIRVIFLTVLCFFICWAPYNVFHFFDLLSFKGLIPPPDPVAEEYTYVILHTLVCVHFGVSPLIHIYGAKKFRKSLRCTLVCKSAQTFSAHNFEMTNYASGKV